MSGEPATERAVWTRVHGVADRPLDLMTARFTRHRYAPHSHEEFAIGACVAGVEQMRYRGVAYRSGPGNVVVVEPGETHTGEAGVPEGYAYRVFYSTADMVGEGGAGTPHFPSLLVPDASLAGELVALHTHLTRGGDVFEGESRLVELLRALVARHAVGGRRLPERGSADAGRVARAVRERLADQLVAPPSLAELAAGVGLSRHQTLRAFRDVVGLPPYAWLAQHRVHRAKALLARGTPPADAALAVGFADQAHMGRWFRRVLGVTPGGYRNSVLDRPLARRR